MNLKNVTTPEKNVREIEFVIEKDAFDKAVDTAFKKNASKMNVPGFRKGKGYLGILCHRNRQRLIVCDIGSAPDIAVRALALSLALCLCDRRAGGLRCLCLPGSRRL